MFHPKRKNSLKNAPKIIPQKYKTKNTYYQNPKKNSEKIISNKTQKNIIPNASQTPWTQVVTCYECRQIGHKANKCPLEEKIYAIWR